jgi:hypothetical protein
MAGAGYKLFNTGDVLTAAQVNTYLQEQVVMVFANATARTTALSGVLAEGMVSFLKDTDALEIYSGTAWVGYGSGDITGITTGATSGLTGGVTSGTADLKFNTTAKGGLLVGTGSGTVSELTVGANNTTLVADSSTATGLKWAAASSSPTFVGCQLWNTTTQSLSNDTYTVLTFDSELIDTDAFHSTSSNTGRITIPSGKDGKYLFIGSVNFASGTGPIGVTLYKNNAELTSTGTSVMFNASYSTSAIYGAVAHIIISAVAGDYFELRGYQNSGGTRSTRDNHGFGCVYLGA